MKPLAVQIGVEAWSAGGAPSCIGVRPGVWLAHPLPVEPATVLIVGLLCTLVAAVGALLWSRSLGKQLGKSLEKLSESRDTLVRAQRVAKFGSWVHDLRTGRVEVSEELRQIFGTGPNAEEGAVEEFLTYVHEHDRAAVRDAVEAVLRGKAQSLEIENRVLRPDGEVRWVHARGDVERDAEGRAVRMIGVAQDITERKRAEEKLAVSERKWRGLVESVPDLIVIMDPDGVMVFVGSGAMGEEAAAGFVGMSAMDFIAPEDHAIAARAWEEAIRTGGVIEYETHRINEQGEKEWWRSRVRVVEYEGRDRLLVVARNTTEAHRLEHELRDWRARYESAARAARQILYIWDTRTNAVTLEGNTQEILGIEPDSVRDLEHYVSLVHPEDVERFDREIADVQKKRTHFHLEYRMRSSGGRYIPVEDFGVFVEEDGLPTARMIGFVADMTERERARSELMRKAEELTRSNADLERFAYLASHDLQEPLRMVASYTQLLARRYRGKLDADADEFIGYAVEGAQRMQKMIDDLLTFSRASNAPRRPGRVPLGRVVDRARAHIATLLAETGATIEAEGLPEVTADEGQLVQVLQNLFSNAVKFRGAEPPRIRVSAGRTERGWVVEVADNGIGIEERFFERVFGMFQRLHARSEYEGNGIGLAICKRIVERHGGRIWVRSTPGRGSVFCFLLPEDGGVQAPAEEPRAR